MIYKLEGAGKFARLQVSTLDGMSPLGHKPWVIYSYPHITEIRSQNLGYHKKCIGGLLVIF